MGDTKSSHVWRNLAIVGAVLAVFVAVAIALTPKRTDDTDWVRRQAALDAAQARQALEQPWSYGRNSDPQRDGFMFEAFTPSLKEIVQKPPKPSSIVYLTVRTEAKTGLVAYIDFPRDTNWKCSLQGCNSTPVRGVIVCAAEGCRAPVRFDDARGETLRRYRSGGPFGRHDLYPGCRRFSRAAEEEQDRDCHAGYRGRGDAGRDVQHAESEVAGPAGEIIDSFCRYSVAIAG